MGKRSLLFLTTYYLFISLLSTVHASAQSRDVESLILFRNRIDSLDEKVIELLGRRMGVVDQVGKYKARLGIPSLQQSRFDAILQKNIIFGKSLGLTETFVTELMQAIHKESLGRQQMFKTPTINH